MAWIWIGNCNSRTGYKMSSCFWLVCCFLSQQKKLKKIIFFSWFLQALCISGFAADRGPTSSTSLFQFWAKYLMSSNMTVIWQFWLLCFWQHDTLVDINSHFMFRLCVWVIIHSTRIYSKLSHNCGLLIICLHTSGESEVALVTLIKYYTILLHPG